MGKKTNKVHFTGDEYVLVVLKCILNMIDSDWFMKHIISPTIIDAPDRRTVREAIERAIEVMQELYQYDDASSKREYDARESSYVADRP
jgi:hypothetical protein